MHWTNFQDEELRNYDRVYVEDFTDLYSYVPALHCHSAKLRKELVRTMIRELWIARLSIVAENPRTRAASHLPETLRNLVPNLAQDLFCELAGVLQCVL